MKNRFSGVSLNTIFTIFALILAISCNSSMAADVCDVDGNNIVNQNDVSLIFQARNRPLITPFDPMDIDRNGVINTDDARICVCALPTTADCDTPLNQSPVTNPGSDQTITQSTFSLITLDGSASSDADGDLLTYLWTFQQRPPNSQAVLLNADTVSPNFTPDVFGIYVLSLTVTDGFGESSSSVVTVTVKDVGILPSTLQAIADSNSVQSGAVATGNITSNDILGAGNTTISAISQNGQPITLGSPFTTAAGGVFLLQADGSYTYTSPSGITDDIEEVFSYTITDGGTGTSSSSTLIITVTAAPVLPPPPTTNKSPLAQNDTAQAIAGGQAVTGNVLSNDEQGDQPTQVTPVSIASTPNAGSYNLLANGNFTYTPPTTLTTEVQEPFTYTITDSDGETSSAILTITVSPQDPSLLQAQPDVAVATAAGSAITGNVLANDQLGNQPVNVTPINTTTASGGMFSLQTDGSYTYIPPQSLNTTINEVFDYTVINTNNEESSSTLTITVNPPSLIPVCRPDEGTVTAGNTAIAGNVLANDDLGTEPTLVTPIAATNTENGGNFSLIANGSFSYTPPATVTGEVTDLFTYTITDSNGATCSSTQTIIISPPSLTPFARPDENSGTAGGDVVTGNVLNNDDLGKQPTLVTIIAITSTDNGGTFNLIADGSYSYTPPATVSGVVTELFTYTITDSDGVTSSSTLTITISPTPLTPLARPDQDEVAAGGNVLTGNVLTNDDLGKEPTLVTPITITGTENGGIFNLIADGSYSYTPPQTVAGVITELFTYTITDSEGATSSSTVTIIVSPQGLEIVCRPDQNNVMAGNAAITGNVLNNDLGKDPIFVTAIAIANTDSGGVFNLLADGSYNYTPPVTAPGVVTDLFTYTITDSDGETCSSTLMITISPATLTPFARPDEDSVTAGGEVVTGDVLTNDDLGTKPTQVTPISVPTTENGGTFNLLADGSYSYAPPATITGVVTESIAYTITDGNGAASTSMLTITINPSPLTPFARPDETSITAGGDVVTGNVLTNDDLGIEPTQVTPISVPSTQNGGTFNLTANGSYSYTPPATVSGVATESFTYTITDSNGATSSSTLMITVTMIDIPLARPDENSVTAGGDAITANLLVNDDLGQEPTLVTPISIPSTQNGGTFNLIENGSYSYSPPETVSDVVTESFTYTMTDSNGATSSSTLSIIVSPQGIEIVCRPDENNVIAGTTAITGDVLINDIGTEPLLVTPIAIASTDNGGVFNLLADGSYSYTPPATVANVVTDLFNYTMTDSDGETCNSTLAIEIKPPNPEPFANPDEFNVRAGSAPLTGDVSINDDLGTQPSQITLVELDNITPSGVLELQENGKFSYTPPPSVDGVIIDRFTYRITDSNEKFSESTLTFTVQELPPILIADAGPDQTGVANNTPVTLDGNGSSDPDGGALVFSWTIESQPSNSQAVLTGADTPLPSFTPDVLGTYVVLLTVTDVQGVSASDRVTITVVDNPPLVANAGPDQPQAGQPPLFVNQLVALDGSNSIEPNGGSLEYSWSFVSQPQGSQATLSDPTVADPTFNPDVTGTYIVSLTVSDASGAVSEPDTVTITVSELPPRLVANAGPDQPQQIDPQVIVNQPVALDGSNSIGPNGGTLEYSWSFVSQPQGSQATLSDPTVADPTFNPDVAGTYVVSLTVSDASGAASEPDTVTITVRDGGTTLDAVDDEALVNTGNEVSDNILDNDIEGIGSTEISSISQNTQSITLGEVFTTDAGGTFLLQTEGSYTYTAPAPVALSSGIDEVFSYTITDESGATDNAQLKITISVEDILARPDSNEAVAGPDRVAISGNVLEENDVPGSRPTEVTPVQTDFLTTLGGTFSLQMDGSYSYMPPTSLDDDAEEVFNYTITDKDGKSDSSTLTIKVMAENLIPDAKPDSADALVNGSAIMGDVLENDDMGNLPTEFSGAVANMQTPLGGVFTLTTSGSYTYLPPNDIVGNEVEERFPYTITDRDNESDSATLTITVKRIIEDEDPIANPDIINISIPASSDVVTGNVLDNDEGNGLKVIPISIEPTDKNGTFNLIADGSYSYTPPQTIAPLMMDTEVFSYTAIDSRDATDGSTLTINISDDPDDLPPFCRPDDNQSTAGKEAVTGDVAKNDDTGTPPIRITRENSLGVSKPIKGTLELNEDGSYTYTPPSTIVDIDSDIFFYKLTDSNGKSCESSLEIRINPDDDDKKPLARPDTNQVRDTLSGGVQVAGNLLLEDVPGDGSSDDLGDGLETITIENTTGSLGGRVELNRVDGSYTYFSPGGGVEGDDMFKYTITDIDGDPSGSTLTIAVTIDPPTADAGPNQPQTGQQLNVGQTVTLDGSASRDAAGNPVTGYAWSFTQRPPNATIELVEPNTATPSFTPTVPGEYILSLTVTDAQGLPSVADTVTITVVLIDPPTANAGPDQPETTGSPVIVDQIVTLDGSASRDAAGNPVTGYQWSFTQRPPNSTADLREANIAKPSFTPDTAGEYILSLTVTDAQGISSVADTVTISVAVDLEDCDVTTVRDLDTIEVKFDPDAPPKTGNVLEGNSCLGKNITLKITSSTVSGIGDNFTFNLDENGNYFILLPSMPVSPTAEKTYIIINNNKDINDDDRVSDTRTLSVKFIK